MPSALSGPSVVPGQSSALRRPAQIRQLPETAWRVPGFTRPMRLSRPDWLLRGFDLLARSGHSALNLAVLCDCPGGARAGFYGFFADLGTYRGELIALWEAACRNPVGAEAGPALARLLELADEAGAGPAPSDLRSDMRSDLRADMPPAASSGGAAATAKAAGITQEEVTAQDPEGAAIECAIRDWARVDKLVAAALARVDAWRLAALQALLVDAGLSHRRATERAAVFYAARLGFDRLRETTDVRAAAPMRALALAILGGKRAQ